MNVNFGRQLYQVANQFSEKTALVNVEKNRSFTYMELHLLTNKICNMMRDQFDMKAGDVYGNLLENDHNSLFGMWMLKGLPAGLWLNYRDSFDEHMYQIDYLNPKILFIEKEMIEKENYYKALRQRKIEIICMEELEQDLEGVHYFWDLIDSASDAETGVEYDANEHITLFRFMGGTTGRGKCAMYTLRNLVAGTEQTYAHPENLIDNSAKFLHVAPLSHASSLFILPIIFKGGTHYTLNVPDLTNFSSVIEKHKITTTFVVPTILYHLVDHGFGEKFDFSSLRTVFYGASPMSPAKLGQLQEQFGNIFVQGYGSTEAFPITIALGKADHIINNEEDKKRLSSAGRPVLGVEVRIGDENGEDVSSGTIGEIWVRAGSVIKGYYKDPEETKNGFSEDGFWKSGDMGYMDEKGYVFLVDRKKDMIITGGFNVYAIEVENAINSHPAVQQSVVIGIPDDHWGEAVHAEVVLKDKEQVKAEELIEFTKNRLGKYKVPKSINFVTELPLTAVGKVLRRKVRDKYWKDTTRGIN